MALSPETFSQRQRAGRRRVWQENRNPAVAKLRASKRYRSFRRYFVTRHPFCCDPFGYHKADGDKPTTDHMHHIQPVESRPDLAVTADNCRPLCFACHGQIEAMERAGRDTKGMFNGPSAADGAATDNT